MSKNPTTMADVIDRLFNRLSATYGADWTRQWANIPISDIKTAWGHELAGYVSHLSAIAYALDNLPERCPNVIQFKNLCRAAPARDVPRIEPPKADPIRVAAVLAKLSDAPPKAAGREWARGIISRKEAGEHVNPTALKMARGALGIVKQVDAV